MQLVDKEHTQTNRLKKLTKKKPKVSLRRRRVWIMKRKKRLSQKRLQCFEFELARENLESNETWNYENKQT